MRNIEIRVLIDQSGLKYKSIAEKMGISASWLSTLMRRDLSLENRDKILSALEELRGCERDEE